MNTINDLLKQFEQYARTENYATALNDLIDYFLLGFRYYDTAAEQRQALETLTNHPKRQQLTELLTEIGELSEGFNDPLGQLYELLVSKGKNGQFFTPEPIADFIAELSYASDTKAGETVLDPACGSGRMLLAAAKRNRHQCFYGADIDPLCCKMALMNMLLHSLAGEIAHMNSLSNEFFLGSKTNTILKHGYHYPYYVPFTDPEQSRIWLRPQPKASPQGFTTPFEPTKQSAGTGIQGSLFEG